MLRSETISCASRSKGTVCCAAQSFKATRRFSRWPETKANACLTATCVSLPKVITVLATSWRAGSNSWWCRSVAGGMKPSKSIETRASAIVVQHA